MYKLLTISHVLLNMDDLDIVKICGRGGDIDEFTAAALGELKPQQCLSCFDIGTREGWSQLMYAIHYHKKKTVRCLLTELKNNSKSTLQRDGPITVTPLTLSVLSADLSTAQLIVEDLLEDTDKNKDINIALHMAIETNQSEMAEILLTHGASPNNVYNGLSCLALAAKLGHLKFVQLLLKYSAECIGWPSHSSPLALAMVSGNTAAACVILRYMKDKYSLEHLFKEMNLEKYWPIFQRNLIGYSEIINLTDLHLKQLGVTLLGPRKKIVSIASLLKASAVCQY